MTYKEILTFARELRKNQTPAEAFFWEKVRSKRLLGKKFLRQYVIQHAEILGRKRFFIADFCCHEEKLIVEIDGAVHREQMEYDRLREEVLREMGFTILRFSNEEVLKQWGKVEHQLHTFFERTSQNQLEKH